MDASALLPLVVAGPLAVAAAMLATAHLFPPKLAAVVAVATSLAVAAGCGWIAIEGQGPSYWFGGWRPVGGVSLGIAFAADPASAAVACLVAAVVACALAFAWGMFDEVHAHFQVMMLLFLAAMTGFCLTRDLFNLFVWFELMSIAAYALTAYKLGGSSLVGALNFMVVNSFASVAMLAGVGLIYARGGQLDFGALGLLLCREGPDPVAAGGFCLIAMALLTKAAVVPFQPWLPDAHGAAPSPVSVVFSAVMAPIALFVLAKVHRLVFAGCQDVQAVIEGPFLGLGCATCVTGGVLAWCQRHLKRLLGFSTISHMGVLLVALGSARPLGFAGLLTYLGGHAMVKGSLFMIAGVLLALRASNDELDLRGKGRGLGPTGPLMALAGLLLAGAPWGVMHAGDSLVGEPAPLWAEAAIVIGGALTGAAVLRAAGRIFLGLGAVPGLEAEGPTEPEREKADRPLWLLLAPCVALLALALWPHHGAESIGLRLSAGLLPPATAPAPHGLHTLVPGLVATGLALALAALALLRERAPAPLQRLQAAAAALVRPFRDLHSGIVNDYLVWSAVGLAGLTVALMLA